MAPTVQIYGPPRSGTNLVEFLLTRAGCDVWGGHGGEVESDGRPWKHGLPRESCDRHVCVVKDPYAWCDSIYRWELPVHEFLPHAERWGELVTAYLELEDRDPSRWLVLAYDDLLRRPEETCQRLSSFVGRDVAPEFPSVRMHWNGQPRKTGEPFDDASYRSASYFRNLSETDIARVQSVLDQEPALQRFVAVEPSANREEPITLSADLGGLGDAMVALWVREGLEAETGRRVLLHTRNPGFVRLFSGSASRTTRSAPPSSPDICGTWSEMHRETLSGSRLDYYASYLRRAEGFEVTPRRPRLVVSPPIPEIARDRVLLFPWSAAQNRSWPVHRWHRLLDHLPEGQRPLVVGKRPSGEMTKAFPDSELLTGLSVEEMVGAISVARLVVANDSGPAHIAGTLGIPTVAIHAAFSSRALFDHLPSVRSVLPSADCSPCHFLGSRGYNRDGRNCSSRCEVLDTIQPAAVLAAIESLFQKP